MMELGAISRLPRPGDGGGLAGLCWSYMAKFLIGLATGVALVFLSLILLFVVALRFREGPPTIAGNSVLVMRLSGELPEKPPMELPSFIGGDHTPLTVIEVWSTLEKAAADSRIRAIVLQPEGLTGGMGQAGRTASGYRKIQEDPASL